MSLMVAASEATVRGKPANFQFGSAGRTAKRVRASMPRSVLIVDDDKEMASELAEALGSIGYEATCLNSTSETLQAYKNGNRYDYLIFDEIIDKMTGTQLYRKLKLAYGLSGVPAILLTGYADLDRSINALRAGFRDFLQKPVSVREVDLALRSISDQGLSRDNAEELSVSQAVRLLKRMAKPWAVEEGVASITALAILSVCYTAKIRGRPPLTKAICLETGLPTSTVVRHLTDLEAQGYIIRHDDTNDKRRTLIELTEAGEKFLVDAVKKLQAGLIRDN